MFLGPVLAASIGWHAVFHGVAVLLGVWAVAFFVLARNAPATARPKALGAMLARARASGSPGLLSLFYFLTFGGFVAFSIYLPTLLRDEFGLTPADAGFRTAGFVVLATLLRPLGGMLSDRIGGARVLSGVFLGVVPFALLLDVAVDAAVHGRRARLRGAARARQRRGVQARAAVLPERDRRRSPAWSARWAAWAASSRRCCSASSATASASSGRASCCWRCYVAGALGAEPPRVPAAAAGARAARCRRSCRATADQLRAGAWATLWTGLLVAAIVVGSRNLQNFDPALVIYTFAVIFATWGVVYHYAVWLKKPPTRVYWRPRLFELLRQRGPAAQRSACSPRTACDAHRRADLHPQAIAPALVDAPVAVLGLPARGGDHVPARLRLDPLRLARRTTR